MVLRLCPLVNSLVFTTPVRRSQDGTRRPGVPLEPEGLGAREDGPLREEGNGLPQNSEETERAAAEEEDVGAKRVGMWKTALLVASPYGQQHFSPRAPSPERHAAHSSAPDDLRNSKHTHPLTVTLVPKVFEPRAARRYP